jgi:hypothetical protein
VRILTDKTGFQAIALNTKLHERKHTMSETIMATSTAEDITELTWEDLALEMAEADDEGPDTVVNTAGGCGGAGTFSTCVTGFTSTGSCYDA